MTHPTLARTSILLAAALLAPLAHAGELWRIDEDGAETRTLAAALECARDGDVLLFGRGLHQVDALLGERTLTLAGEPGARLSGNLTITGDDAAVSVRLVGLELDAPSWSGEAALEVHHFAGQVWLQDCALRGGDPYDAPFPPLAAAGEALRLVNAADVVIRGCELDGGTAPPTEESGPQPTPGCAALSCVASRVAIFDSVLRGGDGGSDDFGLTEWAGEGGPALFQRAGSRSYLWRTRLYGGDGGYGLLSMDGLGGTGLHTEGWSVEGHALRIDGGDGSSRGVGVYQDGGSMREDDAWPRELIVTNPNRDDASLTVMARGVPGESVSLELSRDALWPTRALRPDSVPVMLGPLSNEVPLGLIPPSGILLRRFPTGSLPAGRCATIFAQLRHETQAGVVRGPAQLLVMIDAPE
ncbi:MAG: hypothetical protein KDC14_07575 [Planctomycetes bacterium]|nr:hypothetical protein [Planctomycetota bacterium]